MQSIAKEPCVEGLHTATPETVYGFEVRSNTPAEMIAARKELMMTREAIRRAGKPGLSIIGTMSGTSSEAQCFAYSPEGLRSTDRMLVSLLNDLKVDWDGIKKSMYCEYNGIGITNCMAPVLGGYLGGPETTAIGLTAEIISSFLLLGGPTINVTPPFDVVTGHQVFNEGFFALSRATAAITQNTNALVQDYCGVSSGMCTDNMVYETFAVAGLSVATGSDAILGAITSDAIRQDEYSGMNSRILDAARRAFAGMSLEEANEFVVKFIKMYGGDDPSTFKPQQGKTFQELYDLKTITPTKEFTDHWDQMKKKISDTGLELEEF
jgi:methylamine--corrinoid protein Co-methyltransferase